MEKEQSDSKEEFVSIGNTDIVSNSEEKQENIETNRQKDKDNQQETNNQEKTEEKPDTETNNKKQSSDKSSKNVVFSLIIIVILILGLVYYNQFFVASKLEDFDSAITGRNIKGVVEDSYVFKNIEFKYIESLWYFTLHNDRTGRDYNIPLHFGPREVIDVPLEGKLNDAFINDDQVYITFEPMDGFTERLTYVTLASAELSLNLKQAINRDIVSACAENFTVSCKDRPIITCDNTDKAVIFIKYDNYTSYQLNVTIIIFCKKL